MTKIQSRDMNETLTRLHSLKRKLLAYLREEHPEWEEDRLRRILAGVIEEEPATTDNE